MVNLSMICLSTGGIRTLLLAITVEPGTHIERPPKNSLNKKFIPTKCMHVFLWLKKDVISYPKNISAVKKGEAKKV